MTEIEMLRTIKWCQVEIEKLKGELSLTKLAVKEHARYIEILKGKKNETSTSRTNNKNNRRASQRHLR